MANVLMNYREFVNGITSEPSKNTPSWLRDIEQRSIEIQQFSGSDTFSRLVTAAIGLSGEIGETVEVSSKIETPADAIRNYDELVSELGDMYWYLANLELALGYEAVAELGMIPGLHTGPAVVVRAYQSLMRTGIKSLQIEISKLTDLVKKFCFHGKKIDAANFDKLKNHTGVIRQILDSTVKEYGLDPIDIMEKNVEKLVSRYPGGEFSIHRSENRNA